MPLPRVPIWYVGDCSIMRQVTPRRARSIASVRPTGPAPTTRTSIICVLVILLFSPFEYCCSQAVFVLVLSVYGSKGRLPSPERGIVRGISEGVRAGGVHGHLPAPGCDWCPPALPRHPLLTLYP